MGVSTTDRDSSRYNIQEPIYLRTFPWAIQQSVQFTTWEDFVAFLLENLPYSSSTTRQRAIAELRPIFEGGRLDAFAARVWRAYQDDQLLFDVIRAEWLSTMPPALGRFWIEHISKLEAGCIVTETDRADFLAAEPRLHDPIKRLLRVYASLGFLRKEGGHYVVVHRPLPKTAFLLCLMHRFAPEPSTVHVRQVLEHPFWRYLGGRDESEVRRAIADAEAAGFVRHERVDQLDQITTRFSLEQCLERRVRL
jgi:hypothetical protein